MEIYVFDDLHPEDNAMVQALYSRSPDSVVNHLEKVKASGSGKFMDRYYVGYGHASIGDCGSTTIYIENVSMLVAKAIQDHPLYSGQEASTRYLDFAHQVQINPLSSAEAGAVQQQWIALYNAYMPKVKAALLAQHPFDPAVSKSPEMWDKAITARAFDTVRCLLPVGTATLLSWHTNLRQARDHLRRLSVHPLAEVRKVAQEVFAALLRKYPHSFHADDLDAQSPRYAARAAYALEGADADHILCPQDVLSLLEPEAEARLSAGEVLVDSSLLNAQAINTREQAVLANRPQGAPLPRRLLQYGVYNLSFLLDFGSFRDLQRHRNGYCPTPLVSGQFGFNHFYLDQFKALLTPADYATLMGAMEQLFANIDALTSDTATRQYYYPMGMNCLCHVSYSLPQMLYVAELRSSNTVHPSLRPIAQAMGYTLQAHHPAIKLYVDYGDDAFSAKRGEQDIAEKKQASVA